RNVLRQSRITLIHLSLVLFAGAIVVRAAQVQLFQSKQWTQKAARQHFASTEIPASRGAIYDVSGAPLAMSREMLRLSLSPREIKDRRAVGRDLTSLGVPGEFVSRATDARRAWVDLPGTYSPARAADLAAMRGVYTRPTVDRVYTPREATRRIVGWVDDTGTARGGLELTLDSLLRGTDGHAVIARDARGRRFDSPADSDVAPEPGDAVQLTINQELQEISVRALSDAITKMGATGGDIVILDPRDGESARRSADVRQPRVERTVRAGLDGEAVVRRDAVAARPGAPDGHGEYRERRVHDRRPHHPRRRTEAAADPGAGDRVLEQHRHGEVRLAPNAAAGVRDAARLRLRHADRRAVSGRGVGHSVSAVRVVQAVAGVDGDRIRGRGDAVAAGGGVRRDCERRRSVGAGVDQGDPRARRDRVVSPRPARR